MISVFLKVSFLWFVFLRAAYLKGNFSNGGQNSRGQNPRGHNSGNILPLRQNSRVHFHAGWTEPTIFFHLLFIEFILFKIVKYVGIVFFFTFNFQEIYSI